MLGFHDFTATQAGRADADPLSLAIDLGVHRTQVNIPAPLGDVVGVADAVSRLRLLAADITLLCHWTAAPREFKSCRANLDFTGSSPNSPSGRIIVAAYGQTRNSVATVEERPF